MVVIKEHAADDHQRKRTRKSCCFQHFEYSYFSSSRGVRGGFGSSSGVSPVAAKTSLNAPTLASTPLVSIGMKITFEFCVRAISRIESTYRWVIKYCAVWARSPI